MTPSEAGAPGATPLFEVSAGPLFVPGYLRGLRHPAIAMQLTLSSAFDGARWCKAVRGRLDPLFRTVAASPEPACEADALRYLLDCVRVLQAGAKLPVFETGVFYTQGGNRHRAWFLLPCMSGVPASAELPLRWMMQALTRCYHDPKAAVDTAGLTALIADLSRFAPTDSNTDALLHAAYELGIPATQVSGEIYAYGQGINSSWLESSCSDRTALLGVLVARKASLTKELLQQEGFALAEADSAVPRFRLLLARGELLQLAERAAAVGAFTALNPARLHADNRDLARRVLRQLHLDIASVELLLPDISRSWLQTGAAVGEVSAKPDLEASSAQALLRCMFAQNARIPIVLVLGLPDTAQLAAEVQNRLGAQARLLGWADRDGAMIGARRVLRRAASVYAVGRSLLLDSELGAMVLCINDFGVLQTGLPMDRFDLLVLAGRDFGAALNTAEGGKADKPELLVDELVAALLPASTVNVMLLAQSGLEHLPGVRRLSPVSDYTLVGPKNLSGAIARFLTTRIPRKGSAR